MALEVAEKNSSEKEILIIGIKENGLVIAKKIALFLQEIFLGEISVTALTIDKKEPAGIELSQKISIEGRMVLLVDDVANSGRTMLYALAPLLAKYPKSIQTLALVERTYKQFPIDVDYVGISVSTTPNQHIEVKVEGEEVIGAEIVA